MFENFIKHAKIDIYHLMLSIILHNKQHHLYYDEISIVDRSIPKNDEKIIIRSTE